MSSLIPQSAGYATSKKTLPQEILRPPAMQGPSAPTALRNVGRLTPSLTRSPRRRRLLRHPHERHYMGPDALHGLSRRPRRRVFLGLAVHQDGNVCTWPLDVPPSTQYLADLADHCRLSVGIASAWIWAAVFLQTGTLTFMYGVSVPYWFGVGGFVGAFSPSLNVTPLRLTHARNRRLCLCLVQDQGQCQWRLDVCTQRAIGSACARANSIRGRVLTHTSYLQVAKVRFGTVGHLAYMFAALVANFVVGSEILIGGSGVIAGMTGMNQYAAVWLLPVVIVAYGEHKHPTDHQVALSV